jgi:hypothetical protein
MKTNSDTVLLAPWLQRFFTKYPSQQKQVSGHTIHSYRDTFRLLLRFLEQNRKRAPSCVTLDDIDASIVTDFLLELERDRNLRPNAEPETDRNPLVVSVHLSRVA